MDAPTLPGEELVTRGIADLQQGRRTIEALLVSIGTHRLRALGLPVADPIPDPERSLYDLLSEESGDGAHSRYNALVRRLVSYERAAEWAASRSASGRSEGPSGQPLPIPHRS